MPAVATRAFIPPRAVDAARARPRSRRAAAGHAVAPPRTKAERLVALRTAPGITIPPLVHFTVRRWRSARASVLRLLAARLDGPAVAVRSSALGEGDPQLSCAGRYPTYLDVPREAGALAAAIDEICRSYDGDPLDQVLVQEMVTDVELSGVAVSRDPETGAPYRIVEYDEHSRRTDTITGGTVTPAACVVHHRLSLRGVGDARLRRVLRLLRATERACRLAAVEIEFAARRDGAVMLLQVRPLATPSRPPSDEQLSRAASRLATVVVSAVGPRATVAGSRTLLAQMPDWNPAELIGRYPCPLAVSLFRHLVTDDVWQRARAAMGYRAVPGETLMRMLAGRPYVDVRASFNSFLPAGLSPRPERALVDAWLDRLAANPALHDKVEFEVAQTIVDFSWATTYRERYRGVLRATDLVDWASRLRGLTTAAVTTSRAGSLQRALRTAARLDVHRTPRDGSGGLRVVLALLARCRRDGTLPFAIVARHAFIAEALLRSAVQRGAWRAERLDAFRRSVPTIAGALAHDYAAFAAGDLSWTAFAARWGHVRPGTFDLTSRRYDDRDDLRRPRNPPHRPPAAQVFVATASEQRAVGALIAESGLWCTPEELLTYAAMAIAGRERVKLAFTRVLSDALEALVAWGRRRGLSRDDLAHLRLDDIAPLAAGAPSDVEALRETIDGRRRRRAALAPLRLPPLIRGPRDLFVLPHCPTEPTFVTDATVVASPVVIDPCTRSTTAVAGRVVCIESADPGFDWIFTCRVGGLVTRFGGGNSHMAVRCRELAVPAALGVGEVVYARVARATAVELRCAERVVRPVGPSIHAMATHAADGLAEEGRCVR